jgi:hypothetical protein
MIVDVDATAVAFIDRRWNAWRANRIIACMIDGMSYADAVKWSRRFAKADGEWH